MTRRRILTLLITGAILITGGCSSTPEPEVPSDAAGVAEKVTGPSGQTFLRDITSYEWSDGGQHVSQTLIWIPAQADSPDPDAAQRAGAAAHAIAVFLSSNQDKCTETSSRNPALFGTYVKALIPYLGAMVGNQSSTAGFDPLDPLGGSMPTTTKLFASMACDAGDEFTAAATERAATYEEKFADFAAAHRNLGEPNDIQEELFQAARLRGLVSAGARAAGVQEDSTSVLTPYHLQYMLVSRMVHGSDPQISPEFFRPDGSLKSSQELEGGSWSRYNGQLAGYLENYPQLSDAVWEFEEISSAIGRP
ncbi:hypothetical protein DQP55_06825 [Mycolicibacterium sp. GF69]|uniref:hypothetical protein n=1 Tax=Mycolicibacterium sp. GF69 TaxID=2267251 RepID=UPI000DCB91D5|nr:hypothetical protein [Mycolicibacterium sp. GF69]RAV15077.1 hypothetical protein DQP55_06825 [Mycolicibacterium sp. GF69]